MCTVSGIKHAIEQNVVPAIRIHAHLEQSVLSSSSSQNVSALRRSVESCTRIFEGEILDHLDRETGLR